MPSHGKSYLYFQVSSLSFGIVTMRAKNLIGLIVAVMIAACAATGGVCAQVFDPNAAGVQLVQKFVVNEQFGVSHPRQIIDFDLSKPLVRGNITVIGPTDVPVPFQVLSGNRLAVEIDGLAVNESKNWKVYSGANGAMDSALTVSETDSYYEIKNGLTGVRVPKTPSSLNILPAPLQGVCLSDGTWTGTGTALSYSSSWPASSMVIRFIEQGPLKIAIEVQYQFNDSSDPNNNYYKCTITLEANQPSILMEDEASNVRLEYSYNTYAGIAPTQRRYQGHDSRSAAQGIALNGSAYSAIFTRNAASVTAGGSDAIVDLQFLQNAPSASADDPWWTLPNPSIRRLSLWYPWAEDGGWYDMLYNSAGGSQGNVLGVFSGRASRALGAARSGVGFFTTAGTEATRHAGVTVHVEPQTISSAGLPFARFAWGLFVGRKDSALTPDGVIPPINQQMNLHGGFNLNKLHRYQLDFPDPAGGWGGLFLPGSKLAALRIRVQTDQAYQTYVRAYAPTYVNLFTAGDGTAVQSLVNDTAADARAALNSYVNGSGIYTFQWQYWIGAQVMNLRGTLADTILADPLIAPADVVRLKAYIALFGYMVWDDDFVPLQTDSGMNLGNPNMPQQQRGYRNLFALLLASHPDFAVHSAAVTASVRNVLEQSIGTDGASLACPNYTHADVETALGLALMLKTRGWANLFADEPRLANFAEFVMQLETPPEPRLAGFRGYIPIGDGELTPDELPGLLGTGFSNVNNTLSARLMATWAEGGRFQNHYSVPTLLLIDDALPTGAANLSSAIFPGYLSLLRYGYDTPNETAAWLIGGEFYQDHRQNDRGSVVLYALGQPLTTDWSDGYNPRVDGSYTKSSVVFADSLNGGWATDSPGLSSGTSWGNSEVSNLITTTDGGMTQCTAQDSGTTWTRQLTLCNADPDHPLMLLCDTFVGSTATNDKVMTLNLCATGAVDTPAGPITPEERLAPQLASASAPFALPAGVQRFSFRGSFGIDFDVYSISDVPQQALLGNYGLTVWNGPEAGQIERQHILRVQGTGSFHTLIVPWRKGQKPADLLVQSSSGVISVQQNGRVITFTGSGYSAQQLYGPPMAAVIYFNVSN
jgi:hypothetical protein